MPIHVFWTGFVQVSPQSTHTARRMASTAHTAIPPMNIYRDYDEKNPTPDHYIQHQSHSQEECQCGSSHKRCHTSRLRFLLLPSLLLLLGLFVFLVLGCVYNVGDLFGGVGSDAIDGLVRRATSTTSGNGSFVDHKLYLIIVFVGLLIVVILGIMLSAWCCKGSFENPLCCPCYLCACCGGLACLECIGCGLCAEGLEQA